MFQVQLNRMFSEGEMPARLPPRFRRALYRRRGWATIVVTLAVIRNLLLVKIFMNLFWECSVIQNRFKYHRGSLRSVMLFMGTRNARFASCTFEVVNFMAHPRLWYQKVTVFQNWVLHLRSILPLQSQNVNMRHFGAFLNSRSFARCYPLFLKCVVIKH